MSTVWRKTLVYLGLVEEPEEHDELPERFEREFQAPPPETAAEPPPREDASNVRPLRVPEPGSPHVRAMPAGSVRVAVVEVREFDDAQLIGSRYRSGQPVLFDLGGVDGTEARRILDFVSGVTYALRGRLTKAGRRAFLLVPEGIELPIEERHRLTDLGYQLGG